MDGDQWLLLKMAADEWGDIWTYLFVKARQEAGVVSPNLSQEKLAEIATSRFIEWFKMSKVSFDPTEVGRRHVKSPSDLKAAIETSIAGRVKRGETGLVDQKLRVYLVSSLSKLFPDDETRHAVTKYLAGFSSTNEATVAQAKALIAWTGTDENNNYTPSDEAAVEAWLVRKELGYA
jgi:hypothetical protein